MRSPNKDKIKSKLYSFGYLYERNGYYYYNIKGVRKKTPFTIKDKPKALKYLDEVISSQLYSKRVTLNQLVDEFLQLKALKSPKQVRRYAACFTLVFTKNVDIQDLGSLRNMVLNYLKTTNHTPITVNKNVQMLRSLFNYAIEDGLMPINPVKKDMFQKDVSERLPFTEIQIDLLIQDLKTHGKNRTALLCEFIKITGMRINEVISIELSDIDEKFITVKGKGDRIRYFPIFYFPDLYEIIEQAKVFSKDNRLFGLKSYARQEAFIRQSRVRLGFDIEYANFHAVRKYAENNMLFNMNIPNKVVLSIIGHSNKIQEKNYLLKLQRNEIEGLLENRKII